LPGDLLDRHDDRMYSACRIWPRCVERIYNFLMEEHVLLKLPVVVDVQIFGFGCETICSKLQPVVLYSGTPNHPFSALIQPVRPLLAVSRSRSSARSTHPVHVVLQPSMDLFSCSMFVIVAASERILEPRSSLPLEAPAAPLCPKTTLKWFARCRQARVQLDLW